jgi:hypothetical protein
VDPVIKFVPVTVMVNAGSPAVTLAGEIELIVGTGLLATPPPGFTVEDLLQEKIVPISKIARNDFEIFISSRFFIIKLPKLYFKSDDGLFTYLNHLLMDIPAVSLPRVTGIINRRETYDKRIPRQY